MKLKSLIKEATPSFSTLHIKDLPKPLSLLTAISVVALSGCNSSNENEDNIDIAANQGVLIESKFQDEITNSVSEIIITDKRSLLSDELVDAGELTISLGDDSSVGKSTESFNDIDKSGSISTRSFSPSYNPACFAINVNQLYNYTPSGSGTACLYVENPTDSRIEFYVQNQNTNRQVDLEVFWDEPANYTFDLIRSQYGVTTPIESIVYHAEAGHYYFQLRDTLGDGGAVQLLAAVNTSIDQFEPNDDVAQAYLMPNDYNVIDSTLDVQSDIDYYRYTARNGQDLNLNLIDVHGLGEFQLELLTTSGWTSLNSNSNYTLSMSTVNQIVNVRVRATNGLTVDPSHMYRLSLRSDIVKIDDVVVDSDETLAWIYYEQDVTYYPTQVHNELNWTVKLEDSTGKGVSGVPVDFQYGTEDLGILVSTVISDNDGKAGDSLMLPDCTGDRSLAHVEPYGNIAGTYITEYDAGAWRVDTPVNGIGVGGENVPSVNMAHICKQTLQ